MTDWNWSWVNSIETTNRASNSIDDSGGTLYVYRAANRGQLSASELRASIDSISTNINHLWRLWRNNIRPVLDSLPSGKRDERWRTGRGLPTKIDALTYGIQGSTVFVFNDATSTKASGKYWHITDERPLTIAEAFEDIWDAINDIDITSITAPTSVDLSPLWYAIGNRYQSITLTSVASSLDKRTEVLESYLEQLREDIYEPSTYPPYTLGYSLDYSIAQNLDLLLKAHGISGGWQTNPTGLGHGTFAAAAHTHPYDEVTTTLTAAQTQDRVAPLATLENEIKRIRYEIARTRGGSGTWYSDPEDPVSGLNNGNLHLHTHYSGSGTQTTNNPHGLTYTDLGIGTYLGYIANFIGMSDYTASELPDYWSTNYVSDDDSLEEAISTLDDAIAGIDGFVFKRIYDVYRPGMSETTREQTPIIWAHGMGEYPVLNFIDLDADEHESWGMYSSPTIEVQVDYPDLNTIRVWTAAENIRIIALFGGTTGGPSPGITEYVRSIKAEITGTQLYGDITLIGGSNVTLTRSGQVITIDSSSGGGTYWTESGTALIPYVSTYSVRFGPGTAAAPGLVPSTDIDTGLYLVSANRLGISAAGTWAASFGTTSILFNTRIEVSNGFYDAYKNWSASEIKLSLSAAEWTNIASLIGSEGSIFGAILAASTNYGGLDDAYNNGVSITADAGAVAITVPDNSNNAVLELTNSDVTNHPNTLTITKSTIPTGPTPWSDSYSIFLTGYAEQTIWSDKDLYFGKTGSGGGYTWLLLDETASGGRAFLDARDTAVGHVAQVEVSATSTASYTKLYADTLYFLDLNHATSTWSASDGMVFSAANSEWDNAELVIGSEGSLLALAIAASRTPVSKNSGAVTGTRRTLNFIEGANVTLTIADDAGTGIDDEEIDITIACTTFASTAHASTHIAGGSDEIDGDLIDIDYVASNYSPYASTIEGHLIGIDAALGSLGIGGDLDDAYDYPTAGAGNAIVADNNAVTITVPDNSANECLELTQNDTTNQMDAFIINQNANATSNWYDDAYAIYLTGTATQGQVIFSDQDLTLGIRQTSGAITSTLDILNIVNGAASASTINIKTYAEGASGEAQANANISIYAHSENVDSTIEIRSQVEDVGIEEAMVRIASGDNSNSSLLEISRTQGAGLAEFSSIDVVDFNSAELITLGAASYDRHSITPVSNDFTVDPDNGIHQVVTISANSTFDLSVPTGGSTRTTLVVYNSDASDHTLTITGMSGVTVHWVDPTTDGFTCTAGEKTYVTIIYDTTNDWAISASDSSATTY